MTLAQQEVLNGTAVLLTTAAGLLTYFSFAAVMCGAKKRWLLVPAALAILAFVCAYAGAGGVNR